MERLYGVKTKELKVYEYPETSDLSAHFHER